MEKRVKEAGCSDQFVQITLLYKEFYSEGMDIEEFIELVEEKHAIVEAQEYDDDLLKRVEQANKIVGLKDIFNEEESEDQLNET